MPLTFRLLHGVYMIYACGDFSMEIAKSVEELTVRLFFLFPIIVMIKFQNGPSHLKPYDIPSILFAFTSCAASITNAGGKLSQSPYGFPGGNLRYTCAEDSLLCDTTER